MQVTLIDAIEATDEIVGAWERLASGHPLRSPNWLLSWWEQYADTNTLNVLVVRDLDGEVVGLAPWYRTQAKTIRCLGDGIVCTDHSTLLIDSSVDRTEVIQAIGRFLMDCTESAEVDRWSALELEAIPQNDLALRDLAIFLERQGASVFVEPKAQLWELDLSQGWDEYLKRISKNSRKNMRRLQEKIDQVSVRWIDDRQELDSFLDCLIELHQKRRQSLGEVGCFAEDRFTRFIRNVAHRFFRSGATRFVTVEQDNQVISADFALAGPQAIYCYQSGVEPNALKMEPGKVSNVHLMQRACRDGIAKIDFLRGDEAYKNLFGAQPSLLIDYRIAAPDFVSRLNHQLWVAKRSASSWAKQWMPDVLRSTIASVATSQR